MLAQAVNDVQRGNYLCKASDAVKLAAIHYYVWHGPFDAAKEQFSISYMRELRLGEQLMPTPLVTAQARRARQMMNGPRATPRAIFCRSCFRTFCRSFCRTFCRSFGRIFN